ncbi:hypothetical protein [Aquamicrobium defluvii]|uniref:Uncharacterized protein n=1 Tax=Aquamicrobium defluvii TaxID=69279 RepID=A0A4R6YIR9_9HYPH|nr:hypothetical protein [Aquamicrobium defluvii]TDR36807.1 hypothetical protein DES43_104119 [Aquamicrobium defluvii]TDR36808.1 hypothetical protein DES43_104127 [Aquamicrobium defluvii]
METLVPVFGLGIKPLPFEALGTRRKIVNLHVAFIKADLPPSFLFLRE